jgi:DNA-binding MarR family transcriptional regulator
MVRERTKYPTPRTDGHDLALALRAAYLALHRRSDAYFVDHGVTADQFVLLAALAGGDARTQRDLARRAASDPNTVRAMLVLLEGQGLVARGRHPTDGRARTVSLTAKGRRVYERLWVGSEPIRERLLAAFGPDEVQVLLGLLDRVRQAMEGPAATEYTGRTRHHRSRKGVPR